MPNDPIVLKEPDKRACRPCFRDVLEKDGKAIVVLAEDGTIEFANKAAGNVLGIPGSGLAATVDPDCRNFLSSNVAAMAAEALTFRNHTEEELRKKIAALEEEKAQSEAIISAIGDGVTLVDSQCRIMYQNQAERERVGEHIGDLCHAVFAGRDTQCEDCCLATCFADGTIQTVEKSTNVNNRQMYFEITMSPLKDADDNVIAGIRLVRNVTERKQAEAHLKFISNHDALTRLYNRAYFEEELVRLERGRQFPVGIVMADVDDLKELNDRLGHAAGDVLLRQVALLLKESFRGEDTVSRIGGDEFAVLLPDTSELVVQEIVSRLRDRLLSWNGDHRTAMDLSIGVAVADSGAQLHEALKQADREMYRDKVARTGRPPRRKV